MYIVLWKVLELPLTYSKYFKALFRGLHFMTCHGDCGKKVVLVMVLSSSFLIIYIIRIFKTRVFFVLFLLY